VPGEREADSQSEILGPEINSATVGTDNSLSLPTQRCIPIPHDFDLFHLVLRYLYTHSLCFTTSPSDKCNDSVIPTVTDAEEIYKIAAAMKIEPLRAKALHFIRATCSIINIGTRTFSKLAEDYSEVREVYDAYVLKHWNTVIDSPEFGKAAESEGSMSKLLQLVRRAKTK
jgi:hypothetical protein